MTWTIVETQDQFIKQMGKIVAQKFNRFVPLRIPKITERVRKETRKYLEASPTYESLVYGDLRGHFGILSGSSIRIGEEILDIITDNIYLRMTRLSYHRSGFRGGLRLVLDAKVYEELLAMSDSFHYTENGYEIPWMQWLLFAGSELIIADYHIVFKLHNTSRSGIAFMSKGGTWKVPSEHQGTATDNWITRTLVEDTNYLDRMGDIIGRAVL